MLIFSLCCVVVLVFCSPPGSLPLLPLCLSASLCSDVGVKEYLVWLEKSGAIASFIRCEIDDTHLFVEPRPRLFEELQEYLDAWSVRNRSERCGRKPLCRLSVQQLKRS